MKYSVKDIILACEKLYQKGLVANHDGNITYRLSENRFLATPTSFSKGDVTENDLIIVDDKGKVVDGRHKVFSEISYHLEIYKVRSDIKCVVHAHPPTASGFALGGVEIGTPPIPEAIVSLGRGIFNTTFISPLDLGPLPSELRRVLGQSDGFLIPGNGAWTVGQDVMQTYYRMELIEHIALQTSNALKLGKLESLPADLVEKLLAKRAKPAALRWAEERALKDLVTEEVVRLFS